MQDDFGYQMTLKLPAKNEQERGNVNASTGGMSSRTPTSPGRSPNAPPIQWPDDSDDEVDASLTEDGLTEAERFERFMDSVHVTGDDGVSPPPAPFFSTAVVTSSTPLLLAAGATPYIA